MTSGVPAGTGLAERIASTIGRPVTSCRPVDGRGFMADHYRVTLGAGASVFVKHAVTDFARTVLKGEALAYATIGPQPYLPTVVAYHDDLLIIEDLAHARWPPPWRPHDIPRVQALLADLAATTAPHGLRGLDPGPWPGSWSKIAADPEPLIALGVCSDTWLDGALDLLIAADGCPLSGDALVHGDCRSDNLCLLSDKVIIVDWAAATRGRPDYDLTSFAVATAAETEVLPDHINPTADPALVASLTSVLACHAPNERVPRAIREQLERHLHVALPWCARLLDLAPP